MKLLKSIVWIAAGGIGGAIGTAIVLDENDDTASSAADPASFVETVADFALGRDSDARSSTVAEHVAAYRQAQQESDPEELASSLERAARRDWSPSRDVEIDALLGRLADLAPEYAATVAESLGLDLLFVAQAYLSWAESDPDAALAALARIPNAAMRRDVALALTDVFGGDTRGIARISSALAPADGDALRVAWLAERASTDPFGAFREATSYGDSTLARSALEQVAISWAAEDPAGALAQAELLPRNLAQVFRSRVFTEWARLDPEGYVAYLESLPDFPSEAAGAIQSLAALNPELIERVAKLGSGESDQVVQIITMQALAMSNPEAARVRAEALPPGQQRDQAIQAVASALARTDPRAAIEWVRGLSPPVTNAMSSIVSVVAQTDIDAALDLLDDPLMAGNTQLTLTFASTASLSDPVQTPRIAERLLARTDAESRAALSRLVTTWMQRDPENALEWVLARGTDVDQAVMASAAQTMAARDPRAAAAYVDRIPQGQRSVWIVQVATGYGRSDPQGALNWVSQFQGQEFYDTAMRQLVAGAAQTDPFAAAQMLRQSGPNVQFGAAQQVATALAQRDPAAALGWAQSLTEPRARSSAQVAVVTAWSAADPAGARSHVLAQPASTERDQSITNLFQRAASAGTFDRELLNELSNQANRQQLAGTAITLLARTNLAQARALLESEITDPAMRARIEGQMEQLLGL
jgi:hypothetical protein